MAYRDFVAEVIVAKLKAIPNSQKSVCKRRLRLPRLDP